MADELPAQAFDYYLDGNGDTLVLSSGLVTELGRDRWRWRRAVRRHYLLPIGLPTHGGRFDVVRVIVGAPPDAEAPHGVATASHQLELLDDRLIVSAARDYVECGDTFNCFQLTLPAGRYRVDVHLCLPRAALFLEAQGVDVAAWWTSRHAGAPPPPWLESYRGGTYVDVIVCIDRLRGEPPPRQALHLPTGDFLDEGRFVMDLADGASRVRTAALASEGDAEVEELPSPGRSAAVVALLSQLDAPTAEELAEEAPEAELLAEHERQRQAQREVAAANRARALARRQAMIDARNARQRLAGPASIGLWRCDLAVECPDDVEILAEADRAAAAVGVRHRFDVAIGEVDSIADEGVARVYASADGASVAALVTVEAGVWRFEVITPGVDGRVAVTSTLDWELQALEELDVVAHAEVGRLELAPLWARHHQRDRLASSMARDDRGDDDEALASRLFTALVRNHLRLS